jgi:protein gp37
MPTTRLTEAKNKYIIMAENSEIAWCDHTLNLWWGCTEVHAGCDNCYAKKLAHRWGQEVWGNDTPRLEVKSWISDLMRFQKKAFEANQIHRVFIGSMMDIFEKSKPLMNRDNVLLPYSTGDLRD